MQFKEINLIPEWQFEHPTSFFYGLYPYLNQFYLHKCRYFEIHIWENGSRSKDSIFNFDWRLWCSRTDLKAWTESTPLKEYLKNNRIDRIDKNILLLPVSPPSIYSPEE